MANVRVVVGQLMCLRGNRIGHFGATITCVHTVEPRESVQQFHPVAILDMHARGGRDDPRRCLAAGMLCKVSGGVEEVFPIPLGEVIIIAEHRAGFLFQGSGFDLGGKDGKAVALLHKAGVMAGNQQTVHRGMNRARGEAGVTGVPDAGDQIALGKGLA